MKKFIALTLAAMLILTLAACSDVSTDSIQPPADVSSDNTTPPASSDNTSPSAAPSTQPQPTAPAEVSIEETVLVDEAGVKITAKSLDGDALFGPEIKLLIENNSGKDLTFQCRNASINGYMVETLMSVDVVNGKKANDSLTFMASDLDTCGIETIGEIEFAFHLFDTADWNTYLDTVPITVKTSAAGSFTQAIDDSGDLAYEEKDIRIIVKGLSTDNSIFGPSIIVYLENNSSEAITVQARDVSVNGFMLDALFSCDVAAGKRAVSAITFLDSDLESNGILSFEEVELSFHVFNFDSWDTIADTSPITITF